MLRQFRLVAFAIAIAAVAVVPSASSRAHHANVMCAVDSTGTVSTTTDPAPNGAYYRLLGHRMLSPGYNTCGSYDWQVSPSYTGDYYADSTSADAAEPPPPAPVTPALPTWKNLYDWPNGHGYAGWHTASSSQAGAYGMQSALGGNYGLWLWPVGGSSYSYSQGQYAEWTYTAPGTTRLANAAVSFTYKNKLLAHHCIDIGFRTAAGAIVTHNEHCVPVQPPDSQRGVTISLVDPSSTPTSLVLYVRIRVDCGGASTCSKNIPQLDPLSTGGYVRVTKVDMTLTDGDQPVVTPSGSFWDLGDNYSNGRVTYDLTVGATDAGSGIVRSWVERVTQGTLATSNAPCDATHRTDALDNRICPPSYSFTTAIDTNPLPEGTNRFVAKSVDLAGNTGSSTVWPVYIDRTPPAVPAGIALNGFDSTLGIAAVTWNPSSDPNLPDGVPGSGLQQYQARYQINGGGFTGWQQTDDESLEIGGVASGNTVNVEVQALDKVGNLSATGTATFVVPTVSTTRGPVLTGRLVNASGVGIPGSVSIFISREGTSTSPVGSTTASSDGTFAIQVDPTAAKQVADEALANGGWVNFDVAASNDTLIFNGPVARKIDINGWSDGTGDPAPMTITLASDGAGITATSTTARRLYSSARSFPGGPVCFIRKDTVAENDGPAIVGELHTGSDQHAYFEYGQRADSHIEIGFSLDGSHWKGNGSVHVQNSVGSGNEAGVRWNEGADWGHLLVSTFHYKKYKYIYTCPFVSKTWYEVHATEWRGGTKVGADVSNFDHQCLTTYSANKTSFAPGSEAFRRSNKAFTIGGGASIFGISLDISSGYSKWADSHWFFGRKFSAYWLCGNDANYLKSKRVFAGG